MTQSSPRDTAVDGWIMYCREGDRDDSDNEHTVRKLLDQEANVCVRYGKDCAPAFPGSRACMVFAHCDPFCALQACLKEKT